MPVEKKFSNREVTIWIFLLSIVAVGLKNFEVGLSMDAAFYSVVSRHIARTGEWFKMFGGVPDFLPYYEHPHLGYWIIAVFFKFFGAQDWVARMPGEIFYFAFLLLYYFLIKKLSTQKTAVVSVLLLWTCYRFSNFFSNVYLDPGLIFFTTLSIYLLDPENKIVKPSRILFAGGSLALAVMFKGMVIAGFGPAFAYLLFRKHGINKLGWFIAGFLTVLSAYFIALHFSEVPEFVSAYLASQSKQRFGKRWDWVRLVDLDFWKIFLFSSNYLAPLALIPFFNKNKKLDFYLPVILTIPFLVMYSCANLKGGQYWLTILPWVIWLVAKSLDGLIKFNVMKLIPISQVLCILILFIIQMTPVRIHGSLPPIEVEKIREWAKTENKSEIVIDAYPVKMQFGLSGVYAWYNDLLISYASIDNVPKATSSALYLYLDKDSERLNRIKAAGWCQKEAFYPKISTLWTACDPH